MKQNINRYIENCDICQKIIVRKYKPYGLLQSLPRSESPWKNISINFITGLSPSLRGGRAFDVILAVVDRYSKIIYFILITIDVDIPALTEFIYDKIIKYHDISKSIISNREFIFIFK
jgi:putative transposase